MHVRWIEPEDSIEVERGQAAVCISPAGSESELLETLRSLASHTPANLAIVVCDAHGTEGTLADLARDTGRKIWLAPDLEAALRAVQPADVVLLRAGCEVGGGWLEGLTRAAYHASAVATASPVTTDEIRTSLGHVPGPLGFEQAADAVAAKSLRITPRLRQPSDQCAYVRRTALELLDSSPADSGFAARCLNAGLLHVLADNVLVRRGVATPGPRDAPDRLGPVARSLSAARRAVRPTSVIVDARNLSGPMDGTRVHVLELIAALARTGRLRLTAIVPPDLSEPARGVLKGLPDVSLAVGMLAAQDSSSVRGDVVHRPFQVSTPADLAYLGALGDRLVVTHQDLIGYHNPSYFRSPADWERYRALTRTALAVADHVVFFSASARDDALAEDLVETQRASVVHIGVDHAVTLPDRVPERPPGAERLDGTGEVVLCLGTDLRHKNRLFALRLLEELRDRHGWDGRLVLAGPHVAAGSSAEDEERWLAAHPRSSEAVIRLGEVSEPQKAWLYERAALVLYPTVNEGFGLVPFESAGHGVPCAWASGSALSELLPEAAATIVPWDVIATAERALALLRDGDARASNLRAVTGAAAPLTWDATAVALLGVYASACDAAQTPAGGLERRAGLMQAGLSEDALRLVGPDGALPRELERPLLALASHPRLGRPLLGAIKAGYRASYRWRRGFASDARSRTRAVDR